MMNTRDYASYSHEGQDWTQAFTCAIEDLRQQGGGVLTVPAGTYYVRPLVLKSDMTLELKKDADVNKIKNILYKYLFIDFCIVAIVALGVVSADYLRLLPILDIDINFSLISLAHLICFSVPFNSTILVNPFLT